MTLKPSWNDAPEWASYLAEHSDGEWAWFENKPRPTVTYWRTTGGRMQIAGTPRAHWRDTLEFRPRKED